MLNPEVLHVELSSKCVLKCPRCPRTELDIDYLNQEITVDSFKQAFPPGEINNIKKFIFCGHTGDPIYAESLLPVIEYIKSITQSRIRIITNGSYKKSDYWKKLGSLLNNQDIVTFSVDGWDQDSNNLYRVNSNFDSIVQGIKTLKSNSNCVIKWSMIYFSFNQHHVDQMKKIAIDAGCDSFDCVRSSKFDGRYLVQGADTLKPINNYVSNNIRYQNNLEYFDESRRPIPVVSSPVDTHAWARCANHLKEMFLDVRGYVFPCAWFAGGYQDNEFVKQHHSRMSIFKRSFMDIVNDQSLWNELYQTFDTDPLEICKLKCRDAR